MGQMMTHTAREPKRVVAEIYMITQQRPTGPTYFLIGTYFVFISKSRSSSRRHVILAYDQTYSNVSQHRSRDYQVYVKRNNSTIQLLSYVK